MSLNLTITGYRGLEQKLHEQVEPLDLREEIAHYLESEAFKGVVEVRKILVSGQPQARWVAVFRPAGRVAVWERGLTTWGRLEERCQMDGKDGHGNTIWLDLDGEPIQSFP